MLSLTYNDCIRLASKRDYIEFGMNEDEFEKAMINRWNTSPSEVKLTWICKNGHKFYPSYRQLK